MGRRSKVNAKALADGVDAYIDSANPPILAEYAHLNGITRTYLYQLAKIEKEKGRPELSDAIKKLSEAKEVKLERMALLGEYNPSMAIFSLKQLGWRDKSENAEEEDPGGVIVLGAVDDGDE